MNILDREDVLNSSKLNSQSELDLQGQVDIDTIGACAFMGNTVVEDVMLPAYLKRIEDSAFRECINLKRINIPNTVEYIGPNAFIRCSGLQEVNLPSNLKVFDPHIFDGCTSLETVNIPVGVEFVQMKAFKFCPNLKEISIPAQLFCKKYMEYDEEIGDEFEKTVGENLIYSVLKEKLSERVKKDSYTDLPSIKITYGNSFCTTLDCNKLVRVYSNLDIKVFDHFQKLEKLVEVTDELYSQGVTDLKTDFNSYEEFEKFSKNVLASKKVR